MPGPSFNPTLRRSWKLFRAFRFEQSDPDHFYGMLAADSVLQLGSYHRLDGERLLDVGGGPGYFGSAFREAGATYVAVDADLGELSGRGEPDAGTVLADGRLLPFRDSSFGVVYSSNVLEHVDGPWTMADEMVRVAAPGGLVFLSYTLWWGPWGGHETSPWHLVGGRRAARIYRRRHDRDPKNVYGTSLFPITAAEGVRWARSQTALEILDIAPRYLPSMLHWVVRVPLLREIIVWNVVIVGRRR